MEKKIEDYLHFHLGCELFSEATHQNVGTLHGIVGNQAYFKVNGVLYNSDMANYKPILRPLSSLTKEEDEEFISVKFNEDFNLKPLYTDNDYNSFAWLLKNHFDPFGLIESGLAISKSHQ